MAQDEQKKIRREARKHERQKARGLTTATFGDEGEPERCRARSKQSGGRCKQPKVPGKQVCRFHGGLSPGPTPTHGRYSTRLGRFRHIYEQALAEGDKLFDLRETLALLQTRAARAAERVSEKDTPDFRLKALEIWQTIQEAEDPDMRSEAEKDLEALLQEGADEDSALDELVKIAERISVRQEKAWGIKLNAAQVINARDLSVILGRLMDTISDELEPKDARRVLARIDREIVEGSRLIPEEYVDGGDGESSVPLVSE